MRLIHLSIASIIACVIGLLALAGTGLVGLERMRAKQAEVSELLELRERIDDFSVASDQFLLYRPDRSLWRTYRADAEALRDLLLQMGEAHPAARRGARHISQIISMLETLRDETAERPDSDRAVTGMGKIEMPLRSRMVMTELAGHGIAMDTTLDEVLRQRQAVIARDATWIAAGFGGASLLFGAACILAFGLIHQRIGGPARRLEETVERIASGNLDARMPVSGNDEFTQLARAFNDMLDRRRQAEESLHEYYALVEGSRDLYSVFDADYRYMLINRAYGAAYGFDPETTAGRRVSELFGEDFFAREIKPRIDRALAGEDVAFEAEREYRDRGRRQVLIRYYPIPRADGTIDRVGAIVTDLTERKLAEAELHAQARLLDMAGRIGRFGGWAVTLPARRVEWSHVVADIHGMPAGYSPSVEEGLGFYAPEDRERIRDLFTACVERGVSFDTEARVITANGERRWVRTVGVPVRDELDGVSRIEGAFQDISAQKAAEQEAEQLSRRLATMFASITDAFVAIDQQWRYFYANEQATQLLGVPEQVLLGSVVWEQFPELIGTELEGALRQAMNERVTQSVQEYYPVLDTWFDIRVYPWEEGLAVFFRDVSEQHLLSERLHQYRQLIEASEDLFALIDTNNCYTLVNQAYADIHDLDRDAIEGHAVETVLGREFLDEQWRPVLEEGLAGKSRQFETTFDYPTAGTRTLFERFYPVHDRDSRVTHVGVVITDITELKEVEEALRESHDRLAELLDSRKALIDSLPANIALLDGDGRIIDVNDQWRHFGRDNDHADADGDFGVGRNYLDICTRAGGERAEEAEEVVNGLREVLAGRRDSFTLEYPCHAPDEQRWFRLMVNRLVPTSGGDRRFGVVAMHIDITERKLAEQKLNRLAFEDLLTGLLSRNGFSQRLAQRFEAHGWQPGAVVAMVDVVNLRDINDAHGYASGDQLLAELGRRLTEQAGEHGLAGRTGGDEFVLYLDGSSYSDIEARLRALSTALERPYPVDGGSVEITLRVGYSMLGERERPAESLMREAELALFENREEDTARAPCIAYSESLDEQTHERIRLTRELRNALDADEFELHYQPKVNLNDGSLISAEALLRWNHPERGLQPPGLFIPMAEQSQLIGPIGDWALRAACRQLREWRDAGLDIVRIAVNVSLVQFTLGGFPAKVRAALEEFGVDPSHLSLEITESVFEHVSDQLLAEIRDLHELGVRLSLDDFGTGYSSLLYLQRYPFDEIKIDQGFVFRLLDDHYSHDIVRTVVTLAHALDAEAVAEGIESAAIRDVLLELGCTVGQGYYYSVPLAAEDFRWLLEMRGKLPLQAGDGLSPK